MLNSKVEKLFALLLWILIVALYAFVIFPTKYASETSAKIAAYINAAIITMFVQYAYHRLRIKYIKNKIYSFLALNDFDNCNLYLEKCMKKNKNDIWLKYEKLLLLFLMGDIIEFQTNLYNVKNNNYKIEKTYNRRNQMMEQLFSYLLDDKIPLSKNDVFQNTSYLEQLIWILSEKEKVNHSIIIEKLYYIYDSPYLLFKSVSALLLYKEYIKEGEEQKGLLYADKAKQYAPSQEILTCITRHIEKNDISLY